MFQSAKLNKMKLDSEFFNYEKAHSIFTESTRHHQASSNYKKLKKIKRAQLFTVESKRHCQASSNVYIFVYFIKKLNQHTADSITRLLLWNDTIINWNASL
jgi:hypothetical protein